MLGGTLALLNHSLQIDARLLRHHVYRAMFVGILYLFVFIATMQSLMLGAPGQWLFSWIAWLNFWFISLAGISYFATAISEEKEEETLGILRMAGIGPTALLLGKSTSRLLVAGLLLSLQFPFALLAITLGGVTTLQVFSVFLALLAYIALTANLALLCSVLARRASGASLMMTALLGLLFFGPPLLKAAVAAIGGPAAALQPALDLVFDPRREFSVFNRLGIILAIDFDGSPLSFQVKSNLLAGLLLFGLSRLLFDRVTRYHAVPLATCGLLIRPTGRLSFLGTGRAWQKALLWKDFHFITGGKPLFVLKTVGYGLLVGLSVLPGGSSNPFVSMSIWTISLMSLGLLIESTVSASKVFRDEVQMGTFPNLMMLPGSTHRIAYAKVAGCLVGLIPVLLYLAAGVVFAVLAVVLEPASNPFGMAFALIFTGMGVLTGLSWAIFLSTWSPTCRW